MKTRRIATYLVMVTMLGSLAGMVAHAQGQADIDEALVAAKALYREGRFAEAIAGLQAVIGRAERLEPGAARGLLLSDAYLHLSLSYVAVNTPEAAKQSLKEMLKADPNRTLDPEVYAPKVILLVEQARVELAREQEAARQAAEARTAAAEAPPQKKHSSKLVPILLGVGAAGGVGVALAAGGGGDGTGATSTAPVAAATPTPAPTPAPTPTPTPVPLPEMGAEELVLIGVDPASGSSIQLQTGMPLIRVVTAFRYSRSGSFHLWARVGVDGDDVCITGSIPVTPDYVAGETRSYTLTLVWDPRRSSACRTPPFTTDTLGIHLFDNTTGFNAISDVEFPVHYEFAR
jgi:hypothetical protein